MQTQISKVFIRSSNSVFTSARLAVLTSVAALVLPCAPQSAWASGDSDFCDDMECSSVFQPEIIENPAEAPFFRSYHVFYQQPGDMVTTSQAALQAANTKEWMDYFSGKITETNLSFLIYKMTLPDLDQLIWAMEGKSSNLSNEGKALKAEFDSYGKKDQALKALYYIGFAKRCEPIASRRLGEDGWNTEKVEKDSVGDAANALKLLKGGNGLLQKASDKFLQDRYRFQFARLMFYTGRYADAEKYYTSNIGSFAESSMKYRFMDAGAGAMYRQKKYGQANYIYSLIFDRSPALKQAAYFSFHPKEDADWKETLALAKTDREKTVLWQLLGIYADGIEAIQKIYAIDPASKLLPLLLVREVNKAEEDWTANRSMIDGAVDVGTSGVKSNLAVVGQKRIDAIKRIAGAKNTYKPYLWQLSLGHLYALVGQAQEAQSYIHLAAKSMPNSALLRGQVRMSLLLNRILGLKAIDKKSEPYFAGELTFLKDAKSFRAGTLVSWTHQTLSRIYAKGGDTIRSLMLYDTPSHQFYTDNRQIDAMIEFTNQNKKSEFDAYLTKKFSYTLTQLQELKAINQLYASQFANAASLFKLAGKEGAANLSADPFTARINDCHDCDFDLPQPLKYSKVSFASRMDELSQKAQGTGDAAAEASFLLANGFYNMSYYGNGRSIYSTANSNFPDDFARNRNVDMAERYYKRASELSGDHEFKAKATFMAAKAEQSRYYNQHNSGFMDPLKDVHSPTYFKVLKDQYADTKYYQDIIKECGYFRAYLGM